MQNNKFLFFNRKDSNIIKVLLKYLLEIKDYYMSTFKFLFFEVYQIEISHTLKTPV